MSQSWYRKIVDETRKQKSELTKEQLKEVRNIYQSALDEISKDISKGGHKELRERFLIDYKKELKGYLKQLDKDLYETSDKGILKGSQLGIDMNNNITDEMFKTGGLDLGNHFNSLFSSIQDNVIKDIISGNLYKDNKTLSSRIWNYSNNTGKDIQYIISQGIAQKKSAVDLASDLEKYVKRSAKRSIDWGETYPLLAGREVDYNAARLARTSINHAYQTASIQGSYNNPYIDGILWQSSNHSNTCELCISRDGVIFDKDSVPLDHPNGLCTMIPHMTKDLKEIGREIRDWANGVDNDSSEKIEEWFNYLKDKKEQYKKKDNSKRSVVIEDLEDDAEDDD